MGRTLRSKKLRWLLWQAADGKCQMCGCELPDDWHADHVVPWRISKTTNVHDMQALCPACNLQKGGKMAFQLRPFQEQFASVCQDDEQRISVFVTPGGGKSLLPALAAKEWIGNAVDKICWVVPRLSLAEQGEQDFCNSGEWLGHRFRIRKSKNEKDPSRGNEGYVTTYQSVARFPELHEDEFRRYRYALILDESHHVIEGNEWHRAVQPLVRLSNRCVLMSGSWATGNGKPMAFVEYRKAQDGRSYPVEADIKYSRRQAIRDGAIQELEFHHSDARASWLTANGDKEEAESFATATNSNEMLSVALETEYAQSLLNQGMVGLLEHKEQFRRARALVVSPSQGAAKAYLEFLKTQYPALQCKIAISDEDKSPLAIRQFKRGEVDVLVTVAMAYEGLNVPDATHLICMTRVRSQPWIEQMCARVVRCSPGKERGFVYVPDDPAMNAIIDAMRDEQLQGISDRNPDGTGGTPRDPYVPPLPLASNLTQQRISSGTEGQVASADEIAALEEWSEKFRVPIPHAHRANFLRGIRELGWKPERAALTEVVRPTPSEEEKSVKNRIEVFCRKNDQAQGWKFGTTNKMVMRKFRKSREDMTFEELQRVWSWLATGGCNGRTHQQASRER